MAGDAGRRARALAAEAEAALRRGALGPAEELARRAIALDAELAGPHRVAGVVAFRAGRFADAQALFRDEKLLAVDAPARAVAAFNLAGAEFRLERFADAETAYCAAAEVADLAPLSLLNAGLAAEVDGRRERAAEHYRAAEAAARKGGNATVEASAHEHLVTVEIEREKAVREDALARARQGSAALKEKRIDEALALLSAAKDAAGSMTVTDRADVEYLLGHALLDAGRAREAIAEFRGALSLSPGDAEYRYMLGVALDRSGDRSGAREEMARALAAGLRSDDEARARAYLDEPPPTPPAPPLTAAAPRLTVDAQVSGGYDSNYAGGREALFLRTSRRANTEVGAAELVVDLEPRYRLLGTATRGLVIGDRLNALLYLSSDADPYSLIEEALYLEGSAAPWDFLRLTATVEGYAQTSGIVDFALFQMGAQLSLRALFLEGELSATRLRYTVTWMHAADRPPPDDFRYMTGAHHDASLTQSIYPGAFRFSLGYGLAADLVGTQILQAADVIGDVRDAALRRVFGTAALYEPLYSIPYSYVANALFLEGDGEAAPGVHLSFGVRIERRNYLGDVVITPDPIYGYHHRRTDDRLSFDLALKREIWKGLWARASIYLLWSASNIANQQAASPYDDDDKNYTRFVGTIDLLKAF